ncbi:MAG: flippase-like domain-containing protein [Bacteroidetes bacterium]|nr:flippase-like domain-containing protein [Bacteroidota bacterium]
MTGDSDNILRNIRPGKIILPMIIGLGVVGYMIWDEYRPGTFDDLNFSAGVLVFLFVAVLMMITRDLGYMIRVRILAGREITWKKSFNIVMLWEFTSAITPSVIGGTSVAIYFVHKEGMNVGKSTAVVMATSFLDEMYFILMFPLMFLVVSGTDLFTIGADQAAGEALSFTNKYFYFAVIGYSFKFCWVLLMGWALFVNPTAVKRFLLFIFRFRWIRRWRGGVEKMGNDMIESSAELKHKPFLFWIKAFLATFFSWSARYWIVNFLLLALIFGRPGQASDMLYSFAEHILIFARQLVMWIMMLVMPTPGGSGFAEAVFKEYMAEFIRVEGFGSMMAFLWRLVTYYPYLVIGAIIVPRWVKRILGREKAVVL